MQLVYFDESGELGSKFTGDLKYQSDRYLTLTFLQLDSKHKHLTKRLVKKIYENEYKLLKEQGYPESFEEFRKEELKGSKLSEHSRLFLINKLIELKKSIPSLKVYAITVDKTRVKIQNWQKNPNLLYNYMMSLAIVKHISYEDNIEFHPDPKSIKVGSANSLFEYIELKLLYECNFFHNVEFVSIPSENCLNIQLVDFISNIVWRHYERKEKKIFAKLKPILSDSIELFFRLPTS